MTTQIKIPSVGESISEVTIGKWLKHAGDYVDKDEIVLALETDKVNVEVPAPVAGTLGGLTKKEGETARIGDVVAEIDEAATKAAGKESKADTGKGADGSATQVKADSAGKKSASKAPQQAKSAGENTAGAVMPAAARMMATEGVDAGKVSATGPGGRTLKEDVARAKDGSLQQIQGPGFSDVPQGDSSLTRVVPMSSLRRRIAARLVEAQQNAAILTTFNEVDMSRVMTLRKEHQERFVGKYGIKLGFMSFFVKAAVAALRAYPDINAEVSGTNIIYRDFYDIGVAVGGDKGLVVPVVRRAELLSFAELEQAISDYGVRAKAGKLKLDEMTGGTFSISNGGVYGSLMSTPILNPPQSGILGMHNIVERPVGVNGQVVLRPMMYIALSYDHRVVDGRGAVGFLKMIKEGIESPERMLLEI